MTLVALVISCDPCVKHKVVIITLVVNMRHGAPSRQTVKEKSLLLDNVVHNKEAHTHTHTPLLIEDVIDSGQRQPRMTHGH